MRLARVSPAWVLLVNRLIGRAKCPSMAASWLLQKALPPSLLQFDLAFACAQRLRRFLSITCRIIGVKMICMARPILPPGQTMMFGRDMNESCSMLIR